MQDFDLLWRIILSETIVLLVLLGVLLVLLIWWLLRKLVVVPTLTVATDKSSYFRGDTVGISGSLKSGTTPISGATVSLSIKPPTGDVYSLPSVTTDAQGNFSASWAVPADAVAGSFVLTAAGLGVSATSTFILE